MSHWSFFLLLGAVQCALALPPALSNRSIQRFFRGLIVSFLGVTLPLFVFGASSFLIPDWKGGCHFAWIDCFMLGKLALSPLVLWAVAALYAVDVYEVADPDQNKLWVGMGFLMGAIVSFGCLTFVVLMATKEINDLGAATLVLLVPLYTCLWHTARTVQAFREGTLKVPDTIRGLFGSLPFWIGSVIWSRSTYAGLPDNPPNCFVVSAAGRAHGRLIGPKMLVVRRGQPRFVTRQLATFWRLEHEWIRRAPETHAAFRQIYSRVGPIIANQVRSVWIADLVYLLLLPLEFAAVCILKFTLKSHENTIH